MVEGKIPWSERDKFKEIAKAMFRAAKELNVTIRWGGDWNGNGKVKMNVFMMARILNYIVPFIRKYSSLLCYA
ncbi:hypothetical protein [Avibacterium paragallinarum]|uniref:hypothetical protein n=1 Tax=Avibacterium paragallinarum TaxID=728 RepID=UPI00216186AE|nr:hypothetical protein [Avibacterium paragallinarum]